MSQGFVLAGGGLAEITKKAEEKKPVFTARRCVSQIRR
jgi:hypothetical protein